MRDAIRRPKMSHAQMVFFLPDAGAAMGVHEETHTAGSLIQDLATSLAAFRHLPLIARAQVSDNNNDNV